VSGGPPPRRCTIDLPDMVAYGGATWDWHRLHYDTAYVASRQLPAPVVDGQMLGALLAAQAQDWAGPEWRLAGLDFRFASPVYAGETVRCELDVTDEQPDARRLEGRVVVEPDDRPAVVRVAVELVRR
jgi:acyl dehydratase